MHKVQSFLVLLLITVLTAQWSWSVDLTDSCSLQFRKNATAKEILAIATGFNPKTALHSKPYKRYPFGVDPLKNPDGHIMYGFESEYLATESSVLLKDYAPIKEMPVQQWLSKTDEQRLQWLKDKIATLDDPQSTPIGLMKVIDDPDLQFMPEELVIDATLNVEIILNPVHTLEDWYVQAHRINEKYGFGSMQAMITLPQDAFIGAAAGISRSQAFKENVGLQNFLNEMDTLEKLAFGATRKEKDPTKYVSRPFTHPWLGPMARVKHTEMLAYMRKVHAGKTITTENKNFVRKNDASFKYIGSTSFRPDIGAPTRVGFEVRDAHQNFDLLLERVVRFTSYAENAKTQFDDFVMVQPFNSELDFEKLPKDIQEMLPTLVARKLKPGEEYTPDEITSLEVHRNFAYPMKNWESNLSALKRPDLAPKVAKAQAEYLEELKLLKKELPTWNQPYTPLAFLQGAVARFAHNSGLAEAYLRWQKNHLFSTKRLAAYYDMMLTNKLQIPEHYPATVWEGNFENRVARLIDNWPKNIRIVDDVTFSVNEAGMKSSAKRKLIVISEEGLTEVQKNQLMQDYNDAISRFTVSFPHAEDGESLYTRVGNKLITQYGEMKITEYNKFGVERIEPIVQLNPEEEARIRYFIEYSRDHTNEAIGSSSYFGVVSGKVKQRLTNNNSLNPLEKHNCTSWICLAPIGLENAMLIDLVGASTKNEVHTNPGWWLTHLTATSESPKTGYVVFWTKSFDEAAKKRGFSGNSKQFDWNFHRE